MSETELKELAALSKEARELRAGIQISQAQVAAKMGLGQPEISQIELGQRSLDLTRAYVELLKTTPKAELISRVRPKKVVETADAISDPKKKHRKPAQETAIARELKAFLRKHGMTQREFSEFANIRHQTMSAIYRSYYAPSADMVQTLRKAMKKYEGENTPTSDQFKPKVDAKVEAKPKPVAPPTPPAPPKPAEPKVKLIVEQGTRINNGDNIAPLLRLDGKTMHVFTLVPGGVFVSYVAAEVE